MSDKRKARDEGDPEDDDLDPEDDPAQEPDDKDDDDEGTDDPAEGNVKKPKETEVERLARELAEAKKARLTAERQLREAKQRLAKLAGSGDEEPEDLQAKLLTAQAENEKLRKSARDAQKRTAVLDYLSDQYPDYVGSVSYIAKEIELEEDSVNEDHLYDKDLLKEAVVAESKRFVRKNPRSPSSSKEPTGGEGSPARSGGQNRKTEAATSAEEAKKLQELDAKFGGVLSRIGGR